MKKKPLLIFDLDGTLVDSAKDICRTINLTLNHYGHPDLPQDVIESYIGEGLLQLMRDLHHLLGAEMAEPEEVIGMYRSIYAREMAVNTRPFPGVMSFLKSYSGPMGIVTNKNIGPTQQLLQALQLDMFPWLAVFGADSWERRKPDPLPLLKMMELARVEPHNTVMIGDGVPDMQAGRSAGVITVGISGGYAGAARLRAFEPDALIEKFSDLPAWLSGKFSHSELFLLA